MYLCEKLRLEKLPKESFDWFLVMNRNIDLSTLFNPHKIDKRVCNVQHLSEKDPIHNKSSFTEFHMIGNLYTPHEHDQISPCHVPTCVPIWHNQCLSHACVTLVKILGTITHVEVPDEVRYKHSYEFEVPQ